MNLPDTSGMEILRELKRGRPRVRVLIYAWGPKSWLLKGSESRESLIRAVVGAGVSQPE